METNKKSKFAKEDDDDGSDEIDDVINEPLIGAHRNKDEAYMALKEYFLNSVEELKKLTPQERQEKKYQKIMNLGSFSE